MTISLPEKICILDLETEKTSFKRPEKSKLAFVGTLVYTLHNGRYYPGKHIFFLPNQIRELEIFLKNFPGLIIGHNILQFDYRVLRPLLCLDGVVEKTVDTLAFLHRKKGGKFGGISLGDLSKVNLHKTKTISGKSISEFWRQGKQQEVIDYNKNDCLLTKAIWWQLVNKQSIRIADDNKYEKRPIDEVFNISNEELLSLIGIPPLFNFQTWEQKIAGDGEILERGMRASSGELEFLDSSWDCERIEFEYYQLYCDDCQTTFLLESKIQMGNADYEPVSCPKCRKHFREIRAELGYTLIGEKEGDFREGVCQGDIPDPFEEILLRHIESTRPQWQNPWSGFLSGTQKCGTCGGGLTKLEAEMYKNPVSDSLICGGCFTAGRWKLSLK